MIGPFHQQHPREDPVTVNPGVENQSSVALFDNPIAVTDGAYGHVSQPVTGFVKASEYFPDRKNAQNVGKNC